MSKIKQGELGLIYADSERKEFPEGAIVLVTSHNTPEKQYHVTDILKSTPTASNPYILENEETGFKITKEQFDKAEFLPYELVKPFSFKKPSFLRRHVDKILTVLILIQLGLEFWSNL